MAEEYVGPKFKTVLEKKRLKKRLRLGRKAGELLWWCKKFGELGLAPNYKTAYGKLASAGNLSFRSHRGRVVFVITPAGKNVSRLTANDLVEVRRVDCGRKKVFARGLAEPSSETLMHYLVYAKRRDVGAVFHGHSREILANTEKLGLPTTRKEEPYGTLALAREAARELRENNFVVLRAHGFVAVGKTMQRAGGLAVGVREKALKLGGSTN